MKAHAQTAHDWGHCVFLWPIDACCNLHCGPIDAFFFLQTGVVHGYNYIYTRIIFIILVYQCTKEDLDWHDILYIFQFYRISHGVFGDTITKKNISCRRLERYRFMSQDHSRITICEVILARINIQFQWESLGRAKTMPTACMSSHDSPSIRSIWLCFLCILFS